MCKVLSKNRHHLINNRDYPPLVHHVSVIPSINDALLDRDYLMFHLRGIYIVLVDIKLVECELINYYLVLNISVLNRLQQLICFLHVHACHAFL